MGVADDIVDVLYENHVGIDVVEVFDERAVSARTENEFAGVVAEKLIVGSHCDGVGRRFLFR